MTLYDLNETQDVIIFEIKEAVVLGQLKKFMQFQYSLYSQEQPYTDCFESVLQMVERLSSLREIVELAVERRYPCFQESKIIEEIKVTAWDSIWLEISMLVFFIEGKVYMECYDNFLKYIEKNVRESSKGWSIAGAFKCYIE